MPKEAAFTLAWSVEHQSYTLSDRHGELSLLFDESSPTWYVWLEQTTSFAFRGQSGVYTARREQIKPGDCYWYAYQRSQKRVRKKYLGKSEALSLRRLEEVAMSLNERHTVKDEIAPATATMTVQVSKTPQEQILAARLRVPLLPQALVARTHLLTRLQGALEKPVTLVCAPAGSGKSVLVSSWLLQGNVPSAWLSLDQANNDAAHFWPSLFTALDTLYPGVGKHALSILRSLQMPVIEHVLTLLLNLLGNGEPALQQKVGEALLVLDDYHIISTQAIHHDMAFLLEHLPPHLHIIISTRHDPPLPLPRLRVSNRLLELRTSDLCFSREEIALFFARQTGITLSTREIALLEDRTEGWAAGLQLVAILLHERPKQPDILQSIHRSQHLLVEYLGQEILAHLPEHIQHFLLRTSILDQLEGKLCEAISGLPDGAKNLDWLFQRNLFLTPLDESHRWYRYHQIFADVLRHQLRATSAAQIPELHRRAFHWYREQNMLTEAIAHARAAGDWESIANVAEETGVELMSRGELRMVMAWVMLLPRSLVFSRLRLFLFDCWYRWYDGQAAIVVEMFHEYTRQHALPGLEVDDILTLEQAVRVHVATLYPPATWSDEQRANRIAEMLVLYGVLCMQRADGAAFSLAVCRLAVTCVAGLMHRARIAQHLGTVAILRSDLTEATAVLEDALASAIADGSVTWIVNIGYRLEMLYQMMGQLHNIWRISHEILQVASTRTFLSQATAFIFLGNVEYEWNNLEAAERSFNWAITSCAEADQLKETDPFMHFLLGHLFLARILLIRGDNSGARQSLGKIADYLSHNRVGTEVLSVVKGEHALLMYSLGDETACHQWLETFPPPEQSEQMVQRQFISLNPNHHLTYVRVLLVCQRWREAEPLIQDQQTRAAQQGRTGNLIQWLTLHALLLQALGETDQAISAITHALHLAEPGGYLRLFLDSGTPLLTLLYHVRNALRTQSRTEEPTPTPGYLERLILLFQQEHKALSPPRKDALFPLVEPLSEREREVLWHLGQGRSNREIAEQLVIAPSTVKSHVRAVYAKLGVESRTQALVQARKLKLL